MERMLLPYTIITNEAKSFFISLCVQDSLEMSEMVALILA